MLSLEQRLDKVEGIIKKPSFRQNKGLGNEVVPAEVHGHDDVAAGGFSIVSSLHRGLFHAPGQIGRLVLAGRGRAAFCIVTVVRGLECRLGSRFNCQHIAGDLSISAYSAGLTNSDGALSVL